MCALRCRDGTGERSQAGKYQPGCAPALHRPNGKRRAVRAELPVLRVRRRRRRRGARVRALINHSPLGFFTPFYNTITRLVIGPQDQGPGSFPVETGDLDGFVIDVDLEGRTLQLDGPVLALDPFTEVVGVDFEPLFIEDLVEGDLLAPRSPLASAV